MRVLWSSNILMEDVCEEVGKAKPSTGSWMGSLAQLIKNDVDLYILTIYPGLSLFKKIKGITYIVVNKLDQETWKAITSKCSPQIIHIHGTEFTFSSEIKMYAGQIPCLVSIQGLVSECSKYYEAGIQRCSLMKHISVKDILRRTSTFNLKTNLLERGIKELELLKTTEYVIGRTEWDKAHAKCANSKIKYFKCDEVLRDVFYYDNWSYEKCNKHSIFCSGSSVPLKGAHILIKAVSIVKDRYPDVKVNFIGNDILNLHTIKDFLKMSDYQWYLRSLVKKNYLHDNVRFIGSRSALEMKREYLNTNVFVLPSSIENSSNSLCEAQILGVPIIASYVGGTPSLMPDALKDSMYRFEDYEMLAIKIIETFEKRDWSTYTENVRRTALYRHNKKRIGNELILIYKSIID